MKKKLKLILLILIILLISSVAFFGCSGRSNPSKDVSVDKNNSGENEEKPDPEVEQTDIKKVKPFSSDIAFLRGMNMGNGLDSPNYEGSWGLRIQDEHFKIIKEAGFDFVRIPIRWNAYCEKAAPYKISENFFDRVDHVINEALGKNFQVMINIHHFDELIEDPQGNKDMYMSIWSQIAERYKDYPKELMFELLNEPHSRLTYSLWNEYVAESVDLIRETNPDRTIVIGPTNWNNLSDLKYLTLPENDNNIIAKFHFYDPFHFTHQGAEWVKDMEQYVGIKWKKTTRQQKEIINSFNRVVEWAQENNVHIILSEFGAYSKADMASRALYTDYVTRQAELRNISWAYWEFGSGFGAYDLSAKRWRPELLKALIPETEE